jgi:hypothetical protein
MQEGFERRSMEFLTESVHLRQDRRGIGVMELDE